MLHHKGLIGILYSLSYDAVLNISSIYKIILKVTITSINGWCSDITSDNNIL